MILPLRPQYSSSKPLVKRYEVFVIFGLESWDEYQDSSVQPTMYFTKQTRQSTLLSARLLF